VICGTRRAPRLEQVDGVAPRDSNGYARLDPPAPIGVTVDPQLFV